MLLFSESYKMMISIIFLLLVCTLSTTHPAGLTTRLLRESQSLGGSASLKFLARIPPKACPEGQRRDWNDKCKIVY